MRRYKSSSKWLGALLATLVPSLVFAVTVPNEFNAGDPISSADVNANFQALETAINELTTQVEDLQASSSQLTCETVNSDTIRVDAGETGAIEASCPSNYSITGGGCRLTLVGNGTVDGIGSASFEGTSGHFNANDTFYVCRHRNDENTPRVLVAQVRCCSIE